MFSATRNMLINIKKLKWVAEFLEINLHQSCVRHIFCLTRACVRIKAT